MSKCRLHASFFQLLVIHLESSLNFAPVGSSYQLIHLLQIHPHQVGHLQIVPLLIPPLALDPPAAVLVQPRERGPDPITARYIRIFYRRIFYLVELLLQLLVEGLGTELTGQAAARPRAQPQPEAAVRTPPGALAYTFLLSALLVALEEHVDRGVRREPMLEDLGRLVIEIIAWASLRRAAPIGRGFAMVDMMALFTFLTTKPTFTMSRQETRGKKREDSWQIVGLSHILLRSSCARNRLRRWQFCERVRRTSRSGHQPPPRKTRDLKSMS